MRRGRAATGAAAVLLAAMVGPLAAAQTRSHHVTTEPPDHARYEIVQSLLADKWTFRLDKDCGVVSILVEGPDKKHSWQTMEVADLPPCNVSPHPHFQIFLSSLAARFTFLIDTETGETWKLLSSASDTGDEALSWEVME